MYGEKSGGFVNFRITLLGLVTVIGSIWVRRNFVETFVNW